MQRDLSLQIQCLLRLKDSRASTPVITNAMLAKDDGRIKGKRDLMTKSYAC